ncbi:hypothetical protein HC928_08055 [bacterium]|nr:hypothetical protein [bacterium]
MIYPRLFGNGFQMQQGGIEVTRRYIDTELANDVFQAIASGAPLQMSFGFYLSEGDYQYNITTGGMDIYKLQLVETSDVISGPIPTRLRMLRIKLDRVIARRIKIA